MGFVLQVIPVDLGVVLVVVRVVLGQVLIFVEVVLVALGWFWWSWEVALI